MKRVHYSDRKLLNEICKTLETYKGIHRVYYSTEDRLVRFRIYLDTTAFNKFTSPLFYGGLTHIQFSENSDFDSGLIANIILDEIAGELIKNRVCLDYDEFDIKVGRLAGVPVSQYKNTEEDSKGCVVTYNSKSPTTSPKYLISHPVLPEGYKYTSNIETMGNSRKFIYTNPATLNEYEVHVDLADIEDPVIDVEQTFDEWTIKTYYDKLKEEHNNE